MGKRLRQAAGVLLLASALIGITPLETQETVQVSAAQTGIAGRILIPGGQVVGVALKTQGVLVVSRAGRTETGTPLRAGDVILSVNGQEILSAQELGALVGAAQEESVALSVLRQGRRMTVDASVPVSAADGKRRLGVWVRDSTAGVGTLSFVDPVTGNYGALGHAIVDGDTGDMLSVKEGAIMAAEVVGVARGESGSAGELKGSFLREGRQIGTLDANSAAGISGRMETPPENLLYPDGLPAADRTQVHAGEASIISTVDSSGPMEYAVTIERCYTRSDGNKNMLLRVTDARLLEKTGGIVQGMSGSPIVQNGKLVGAVTHVLVNDPTRGYGIFIENMLEAAE